MSFPVLSRLAAFAACVLIALASPAALAHAIIVEAAPEVGTIVHGGAVDVRLRFNSRIDHRRSRLALIDALGHETVIPLAPNTPTDVVSGRAEAPPGKYRLRWQVLALDGHITRGDIPFELALP